MLALFLNDPWICYDLLLHVQSPSSCLFFYLSFSFHLCLVPPFVPLLPLSFMSGFTFGFFGFNWGDLKSLKVTLR